MARLFGTDGVRGLANRDVTAELALSLAVCAAHELSERGEFSGHRPRAVVGRDTRLSGPMLSGAVCAGLASAGVDVIDVGVLPTPGIAYLVASTGADLGVVISASHNAMPDNGIKFFSRGGHKLDDAIEAAIEDRMDQDWERPVGDDVGSIELATDLEQEYVAHVVAAVQTFAGKDKPLDGVSIVVDAAHGAASNVGPAALTAAGANVTVINAAPDGRNINDGVGSTYLEGLQKAVIAEGADLGVAFDGDADRCLAVDHEGKVVDGDQIMGLLAMSMKKSGTLYKDTLVTTVMSNLALHRAMSGAGIDVINAPVGDRYVLEAMRAGGYSLGAEQSGHVILSEYATTGDGVLTALVLAAEVGRAQQPLQELCAAISPLPQVLINVKNVDRSRVDSDQTLQAAVAESRAKLGDAGRVLLRPSGTEELVRVMVEAETQDEARATAQQLADIVAKQLALA